MYDSPNSLRIIFCFVLVLNMYNISSAQSDSAFHFQSSKTISNNSIHHKPVCIAKLPGTIGETSGLVYFDKQLWTINDGGNAATLYQIDTITGKVLRTVAVSNASNRDWESVTQDDSNVYIGDFGNNYGNRKDLCILKIAKSELSNPQANNVKAASIYFSYPDQDNFTNMLNKNNFDCEAFFCIRDTLHLFSKDWLDLNTRHYTIPAQTGQFKANFIEQFRADGLITDASVNEKGNIVLLGYKNTGGRFWDCFCLTLTGYSNNHFFNGKIIRIQLGSALHLGQTEGITLNADNTAWLSSESIRILFFHRCAKLYRIDVSNYF